MKTRTISYGVVLLVGLIIGAVGMWLFRQSEGRLLCESKALWGAIVTIIGGGFIAVGLVQLVSLWVSFWWQQGEDEPE